MVRDQNESGKLDLILSAPLQEIADNGFSQKALARISVRRRRRLLLETGGGLLTIGVCAFILPVDGIGSAIAQLTPQTVHIIPLAAAAAATALSLLGGELWNE